MVLWYNYQWKHKLALMQESVATMDMLTAWNGVKRQLFDSRTNLFYDYVTSHDREGRFLHLPNPQEVKADFPNPCGWGAGMEDCMLNAGSALDILWKLFPDPAFTAQVVKGIALCCEGHGRPGFVARGMTPPPEKHCYSNTSRDQLTLAVYGLWRVIHSHRDISPGVRSEAARLLELIACDCRKHVIPENRYNLLRLDGKPAVASTMWNCSAHEALRLPMVYLAAFEATGASRYLDWANEYLPRALEQTLSPDERESWWHLPIVQMQLSILLIAESAAVPEYRELLRRAMDQLVAFAEGKFLEALGKAEAFHGEWHVPNGNFRLQPMRLQHATISADRRNALFEGKPYFVPVFPEKFAVTRSLLHELGSFLTIFLAPGNRRLSEERLLRLDRIVSPIDFSRHCSDGGIKLLHALSFLPTEQQMRITRRLSLCSSNE